MNTSELTDRAIRSVAGVRAINHLVERLPPGEGPAFVSGTLTPVFVAAARDVLAAAVAIGADPDAIDAGTVALVAYARLTEPDDPVPVTAGDPRQN